MRQNSIILCFPSNSCRSSSVRPLCVHFGHASWYWVHLESSQPKDIDLHAVWLQNKGYCYSCAGPRVQGEGVAATLSRALNLKIESDMTLKFWRKKQTSYRPFFTWGNNASKSFMRCRIRWVTPREDSKSTLCLFFFFAAGSSLWSPFSSSISISSEFLFPFPLDSVQLAFAFWVFKISVDITRRPWNLSITCHQYRTQDLAYSTIANWQRSDGTNLTLHCHKA